MDEPERDRRTITTALVVGLVLVVVALVAIAPSTLRLASSEPPADPAWPIAAGSTMPTSTTIATVPPTRPSTTFPPTTPRPSVEPTSTTTTVPRLPPGEADRRLGDASIASGCEPVAADAALEPVIDPTTYLRPATPDPRAAIPGSLLYTEAPAVPRAEIELLALGDDDVVVASIRANDGTKAVVVGHLDRSLGTFRRVAAFTGCHLLDTTADDRVVVISAAGTGNRGVLVFAVDVRTGALPWRWLVPQALHVELQHDRGTVSLVGGGYRQSPSTWGMATVDIGTGAVRSAAGDGIYPPGRVLDSDEGLWIELPSEDGSGSRFRELDRATLGAIRTIDAPVPQNRQGFVRAGALWNLVGPTLQRRSLTDGSITSVPIESDDGDVPTVAVGPSGIWVQSSTGPGLGTTVLTRVDPDAVAALVVARFPTQTVVDRSQRESPHRWRLAVDSAGATYQGPAVGAGPCRCWFHVAAP